MGVNHEDLQKTGKADAKVAQPRMSALKREINVRYLLHKLAGLVTSNWLKLLTFHGFVLYTMLFFQPAAAMALDQILVSCSGGYRASHSELNERLNFKNDNNYQLNPPVKIWNTAALHRDTEANEFYLQHSTAGTNYYRRNNTRNFYVWKGGDKSLTLSLSLIRPLKLPSFTISIFTSILLVRDGLYMVGR